MLTETTKVIENVDSLFSEIVVNGEVFETGTVFDAPVQKTPVTLETPKEEEKPSSHNKDIDLASTLGEPVNAVELNSVIHNLEDAQSMAKAEEAEGIASTAQTVAGQANSRAIDAQSTASQAESKATSAQETAGDAVTKADSALAGVADLLSEVEGVKSDVTALSSEVEGVKSDVADLSSEVDGISELIPAQATADNQLADKDFVNSSIATNTANFIGTFNTLQELEQQTATNNDYAFLRTTDSLGAVVFKRYKYVADDNSWQYEYDLNNSSFTAEQWEAINSGVTSSAVASIANKVAKVNGVTPVLGDVKNVIPISEADYSALPLAQKRGRFFIRDVQTSPAQLIKDSITATDSTWSSSKINSNLNNALANYSNFTYTKISNFAPQGTQNITISEKGVYTISVCLENTAYRLVYTAFKTSFNLNIAEHFKNGLTLEWVNATTLKLTNTTSNSLSCYINIAKIGKCD